MLIPTFSSLFFPIGVDAPAEMSGWVVPGGLEPSAVGYDWQFGGRWVAGVFV